MPLDNASSSRSIADIIKDVGNTVAQIGGAVRQTVAAVKDSLQPQQTTVYKGGPVSGLPSYPMPQEQGPVAKDSGAAATQSDNKGYYILIAIVAGLYFLGGREA